MRARGRRMMRGSDRLEEQWVCLDNTCSQAFTPPLLHPPCPSLCSRQYRQWNNPLVALLRCCCLCTNGAGRAVQMVF